MTIPLRLSSDLVHFARTKAALQDRSPTAQIEHWAKIGRAVEAVLSGDSLENVKAFSRVPDTDTLIAEISSPEGQARARDLIFRHGHPVYEADPSDPARVVERQPDGTTRRGHFANRAFIPEA